MEEHQRTSRPDAPDAPAPMAPLGAAQLEDGLIGAPQPVRSDHDHRRSASDYDTAINPDQRRARKRVIVLALKIMGMGFLASLGGFAVNAASHRLGSRIGAIVGLVILAVGVIIGGLAAIVAWFAVLMARWDQRLS